MARRRRAEDYRACGAYRAPRAARSTRTLGVIVLPATVIAMYFGSVSAAAETVAAPTEPIPPAVATAKKLPDPGDLYEAQRLKHEKLESETREIERDELATYRRTWIDRQIVNYRYKVSYRGAWFGTEPITVTVRAGEVVSYVFVGEPESRNSPEAALSAERYSTIPKLFALIEELLNHDMTLPRVHYDKQYGFPANITNNRFAFSDDEFGIYIWDFEVLQ